MNKNRYFLVLLAFILTFICIPNISGSSVKTVVCSNDSDVHSDLPNDNFGGSEWMYIRDSSSPEVFVRVWLKFTVPTLPVGSEIISARVFIFQTGYLSGNPVTTIHYSTNDGWTENSITWTNQPEFGASLDSKTISSAEQWYYWTVSSVVSSGDIVSFVLKTETYPSYARCNSKEGGVEKPYLEVIYEPPPNGNGNGNGVPPEAGEVNLNSLPDALGAALGIGVFPAQILTATIFLCLFLFPTLLLTRNIFAHLMIGFCVMGFCTAMGWLPVWFMLIIALIVALLFSGSFRGWITGSSTKGD